MCAVSMSSDPTTDDSVHDSGDASRPEAAELLRAMCERGDASDPRLDPMIYDEVRRLAHTLMRGERKGHTLQATALAHEAYARLIDSEHALPSDRAHFLALVARAMRHILVDHARKRQAAKRGGGWQRVTMAGLSSGDDELGLDLLELDNALSELADHDESKARIVELRFFAGMSVADVAHVFHRSETFIRTEWYVARAWLKTRLSQKED